MATVVSSLRRKQVIKYNNEPSIIVEAQLHTPPNLSSFFKMTVRGLTSGKANHIRCNVGEAFEVLHTDIKRLELSYENQGVYSFMDTQTYESFEIEGTKIEESISYLVVGNSYDVMFVDGVPFMINLPPVVEMLVTESPDAIRGNTASNVQKTVTLETGLKVQVPIFIKKNEKVRINTESGEYMGRA